MTNIIMMPNLLFQINMDEPAQLQQKPVLEETAETPKPCPWSLFKAMMTLCKERTSEGYDGSTNPGGCDI